MGRGGDELDDLEDLLFSDGAGDEIYGESLDVAVSHSRLDDQLAKIHSSYDDWNPEVLVEMLEDQKVSDWKQDTLLRALYFEFAEKELASVIKNRGIRLRAPGAKAEREQMRLLLAKRIEKRLRQQIPGEDVEDLKNRTSLLLESDVRAAALALGGDGPIANHYTGDLATGEMLSGIEDPDLIADFIDGKLSDKGQDAFNENLARSVARTFVGIERSVVGGGYEISDKYAETSPDTGALKSGKNRTIIHIYDSQNQEAGYEYYHKSLCGSNKKTHKMPYGSWRDSERKATLKRCKECEEELNKPEHAALRARLEAERAESLSAEQDVFAVDAAQRIQEVVNSQEVQDVLRQAASDPAEAANLRANLEKVIITQVGDMVFESIEQDVDGHYAYQYINSNLDYSLHRDISSMSGIAMNPAYGDANTKVLARDYLSSSQRREILDDSLEILALQKQSERNNNFRTLHQKKRDLQEKVSTMVRDALEQAGVLPKKDPSS